MQEIDLIVKQMLEEHQGGEVFFEHLDAALRQDETIIEALIKLIPAGCNIITSGRFGRFFSNYISSKHPEIEMVLAVNGGLRKGGQVESLSYLELTGKEFVFVDDSYYKGRTKEKVRAALEENGAILNQSCVIYDGGKQKDVNVMSLYRYFDHFEL